MIEIKEIIYGRNMRVGPAPKIRKLGVMAGGGETTPFVWQGKLKFLETVSVGDSVAVVFDAWAQIRDIETNEVSAPFGHGYHFYSCYEENGTVYVFATNEHEGRVWGGDTITMLWSSDLINWEKKDVSTRKGWEFYNTSVCKGRDGKYVMAVEVDKPREISGRPYTNFFLTSDDLFNWTMMPDEIHYSDKRYTACPVLRYLPSDDYYYMICVEALPLVRYAPYIYRTKDFMTWEIGLHNPVLWISEEDHMIKEGASFTPEQAEHIRTYLNINNCDLDVCECDGKTWIVYATGDQLSQGFGCMAVYEGTMEQFFQNFFNVLN